MFITLEGIEGCGKSTQSRRLVRCLGERNIQAVLTREPGGTGLGREIRRILLDSGNNQLLPLAELLLYEADRAQHMMEVIKPALAAKHWVVCDRFYDATTVYQGFARGQDRALIQDLNHRASQGVKPDKTFLIDCPVSIGLERARKREETQCGDGKTGQDRFEREQEAFHEAVRHGYLTLAAREPARFVVLDGTLGADQLEERLLECLKPFIGGER